MVPKGRLNFYCFFTLFAFEAPKPWIYNDKAPAEKANLAEFFRPIKNPVANPKKAVPLFFVCLPQLEVGYNPIKKLCILPTLLMVINVIFCPHY